MKPARTHLVLDGVITAIDPISISSPAPTRPDMRHESGIQWMPMNIDGSRVYVPYIRGASMRGKLRHLGARLMRHAHIAQTGVGMDIEDYSMLAVGGAKSAAREEATSFHVADMIAAKNPHLSLFGLADPTWIKGNLVVRDARPEFPTDVVLSSQGHIRTDPYRTDLDLRAETSAEQLALHGDRTQQFRDQAPINKRIDELTAERIKARKQQNAVRIAEIDAEIEQLTADRGAKMNSTIMPFSRNAIGAGSRLQHSFDLNGTADEIGHFLACLEALSNDCTLGGLVNVGYGRFRAEYAVRRRPDRFSKFEPAGTISIAPFEPDMSGLDPDLLDARTRWLDRLGNDLDSIAMTRARIAADIASDRAVFGGGKRKAPVDAG